MSAGGAVSPSADGTTRGNYDPGRRRRSVREGRERGCWVYIPAQELVKAGVSVFAGPPWYRIWGGRRGGVVVRLYKEGDKA